MLSATSTVPTPKVPTESRRHARGSTPGWRQGGNRGQVAEVWAPGRNVWPEVCGNAQAVGAQGSRMYRCPRVPDLGAVERAHSSIKLCAASLFEICSTGVEVAQNLATKDKNRGMAKSMQRAASRIRPDPMTRPRPPSPRAMGTAAGVDGAFAVAWAPSERQLLDCLSTTRA
jgi:hypothetical protein